MIAKIEPEKIDLRFPRPVLDGVYLTRFDIYETETEFIFRCRMPDVQLVEVHAGIANGELAIKGKVRFVPEEVSNQSTSKPLVFFRSFPISDQVLADQTTANFRDGVLTVQIPKKVQPD
jgi:HSP20 family protein